MKIFKFGPINAFFYNNIFQFELLCNGCLKFGTRLASYLLFALDTIKIVEDHTWPTPSLLNLHSHAIQMHDMPTIQLDWRFLSNCRAVANGTKVIFIAIWPYFFWHFSDTLFIQAGEALRFIRNTGARMSTWVHLFTWLLHCCETFLLSADVSECWLHTRGWLFKLLATETARWSILLIARLAGMVGLGIALGTEIIVTFIASYSVVGHVYSSLLRNEVTFIIFLTPDHLTFLQLHNISTWATN